MATAFPSRPEGSSRSWWPLSSKLPNAATNGRPYSSNKSSRQALPKSTGLTFNSIASAIGLKSKKQPSLAIQSPPLPPVKTTMGPDGSAKYITRQPDNSVSSLRSQVDSLQSPKPTDGRKNTRQSLITLSETDPFARNGVSSGSSDPNRLSVYSNSSIAEKHRGLAKSIPISHALSSSSNSNVHHGTELSSTSSNQSSTLTPDSLTQILKPTRSAGNLHRNRSILPPEGSLVSAWDNLTQGNQATIAKSGSSSTLTDKYCVNPPEPNPRPLLRTRPRGLTDSRAVQPSVFLHSNSRNASITNSNPLVPTASPHVIVRQPSASRIGSPPSAPPRHELPLPPLVKDDAKENGPEAVQVPSGSSSSLSFASSVSLSKEGHSPRTKGKGSSDQASPSSGKHGTEHPNTFSKASQSPSITPLPLKKALSHQSLVKCGSSSSSPTPAPIALPPERVVEKVPRKQRSFHQPKGPKFSMPPMRHTHSSGSQSSSPASDGAPLTSDYRKDSITATPSPGRKRLFSGSNLRRPSTAQPFPSEDDSLSIFSMRSEQEQASSLVGPISPSTSLSFWDEGTHDHALDSPRAVTHEYTPQQIMSPAEMAKVEASVEESSIHGRPRGLSARSASSVTSDGDESLVTPVSLTWHGVTSTGLPQRSNSLFLTGLTVPQRLAVRPSTSDTNVPVSSTHLMSFTPSSSPPQVMTSLPPPPRRGPRPSLVTQASSEDDFSGGLPLPPVRRTLRPKASVEKALHRRSIMKKPSFLEIDDDTDKESEGESSGEPLNGSFLDLARESFDTSD